MTAPSNRPAPTLTDLLIAGSACHTIGSISKAFGRVVDSTAWSPETVKGARCCFIAKVAVTMPEGICSGVIVAVENSGSQTVDIPAKFYEGATSACHLGGQATVRMYRGPKLVGNLSTKPLAIQSGDTANFGEFVGFALFLVPPVAEVDTKAA